MLTSTVSSSITDNDIDNTAKVYNVIYTNITDNDLDNIIEGYISFMSELDRAM
jgi:LPS O-antigen subunit length determinant protein (WzzB/FepE family)